MRKGKHSGAKGLLKATWFIRGRSGIWPNFVSISRLLSLIFLQTSGCSGSQYLGSQKHNRAHTTLEQQDQEAWEGQGGGRKIPDGIQPQSLRLLSPWQYDLCPLPPSLCHDTQDLVSWKSMFQLPGYSGAGEKDLLPRWWKTPTDIGVLCWRNPNDNCSH